MAKDLKHAGMIEDKVKQRDKLAALVEADVNKLAKDLNDLLAHDLDLYSSLYKPDANFNDSPISMFFTIHWLEQYMIKRDMDFIGFPLDGKPAIKTFTEMATEANKWIMRFTKAPEPEKTGLDAIL